MRFVRFFSFLTVFALLIMIGCSGTDQPENPAANNNPGNVFGIAGGGGTGGASVSVDSICNGNCGRDNQDNTIAPNAVANVWVNSSGNDCSSNNYYYDIFDGADLVVDCVPLGEVDNPCGKWQGYEFVTPDDADFKTSKTANIVVYCGDTCTAGSTIVGGDTFRLVNNGNCTK